MFLISMVFFYQVAYAEMRNLGDILKQKQCSYITTTTKLKVIITLSIPNYKMTFLDT
jgi:hypothetical protein